MKSLVTIQKSMQLCSGEPRGKFTHAIVIEHHHKERQEEQLKG